jgi:DoxX-like family
VAHGVAVAGLAGVWLYQGLVPKVWKVDAAEVRFWRKGFGVGPRSARWLVRASGVAEVAMGVLTVVAPRRRRRLVYLGSLVAMPVLTVPVAVVDRPELARAFNPASLSWATSALAVVALVTSDSSSPGA